MLGRNLPKEHIQKKLDSLLEGGDILLVVPPFYNVEFIALGPWVLKEIAKRHGFKVDVLHLDLLLCSLLGHAGYHTVQESPKYWMLGERMFARSAYSLPPLGLRASQLEDAKVGIGEEDVANIYVNHDEKADLPLFRAQEAICYQLIPLVADIIFQYKYPMVGYSIAFCNQINASIALANAVKKVSPSSTNLLGGSYCEGEKVEGLFTLSDNIDYIFSGESEDTFTEFLDVVLRKKNPWPNRIVKAKKGVNLNEQPLPDYPAYRKQVITLMGQEFYDRRVQALWYESNRGCWWAEKSKCTFCGISETLFRQKSIEVIYRDLKALQTFAPEKFIFFTDLIMSDTFPKKLLALGAHKESLPKIGMQIKIGRDLQQVIDLDAINARIVLPGVESFSTRLLKRMKKGAPGRHHLYFLRNAKSYQVHPQYSLLWGFPGDTKEEYEYLLEIIPLISHLAPPRLFEGAQISRDAPYFEEAEKHGVENLKPWAIYHQVFPVRANLQLVSNYFLGEFSSFSYENQAFMREINLKVKSWIENRKTVKLELTSKGDSFQIEDSRWGLSDGPIFDHLAESKAREVMTYQRLNNSAFQVEAIAKKWALAYEGWFIPLITASPSLLEELDASYRVNEPKEILA